MKTIAYLRISGDKQDLKNQKFEIMEYAQKNNMTVSEFIEIEISSRQDKKKRRIDELVEKLSNGDTVICSELSRIGRSTGEVIGIVNELVAKRVRLIAIKQGMVINGKHDLQSKVLVTLFSLLAEMERDILSSRTVQALRAKKAQGVVLGRPKGALGKSKLDGKQEQVQELMKHKVSKSAIARMLGVSRTTLLDYIRSRKLMVA
jgi:DNA invertase Pin-like site-specific DNA recombinase